MRDLGIYLTKEEEAKLDEMVAKIHDRVEKEPMTPKERIAAVQRGEEVDRIPIWVNGTGLHVPATYGVAPGALYERPQDALLAYVYHVMRFGYDTLSMFRFSLGDEEFGGKTTLIEQGVPFTVEGYVNSYEDIRDIKFPDPWEVGQIKWSLWMIGMLKEKLGDIMPIWGFITTPGLSAVVPGSRDFSSACMDMVKDPNMAHALTALGMKWEIMLGKAELEAGADLLNMVDASGMFSEKQFLEFMYPYMLGLVGALDRRVIWCAADNVEHVMKYYADAGIKNVYLNSGQPLDKAKEILDGYGITIRYGMNPEILVHGPKERIRDEVKRLVKEGWDGGHFILGTEALNANTPAENVDAYMEAAREYCKLPLAL